MHKVLNVLVVDVNYSAETQQMQKWSLPFPTLNLANQFSSMKKSNSLIIPGWFQFERRDGRRAWFLCVLLLITEIKIHFASSCCSISMPLTTPYICRLTLFLAVLVYMNSKQSYSSNKSQEKKFASMGKRFFTKILHLANRKLLMQLVLASYSRHLLPNVMTFKKTSQWQIYTWGLCFLGGLL